MSNTLDARTGLWWDHSRHLFDRGQVLATDYWSRWMIALVAVSLTLVGPCIFKITRSFLIYLLDIFKSVDAKWHSIRSPGTASATASAESQPFLPRSTNSVNPSPQPNGEGQDSTDGVHINDDVGATGSYQTLPVEQDDETIPTRRCDSCGRQTLPRCKHCAADAIGRYRRARSSRGFVFKCLMAAERPGTKTVFIATVLFGVFIASQIANVFSAKIASDRIGLSASKFCGIWEFDDDARGEEADWDDLNSYRKEARASQYARSCYGLPHTPSTLSCKVFYNQSIAFTTKNQEHCPFAAPELCLGGHYSAVTFDTGLVDASVVGINSPATNKFRRTTTCSPLNMSERYVQAYSTGKNETGYRYFYGNKDKKDYTFNTSGDPFDWLIPAYSVNTYFSSLYPEEDYWHPIPELKPPEGSTLTIMFISSMHIYHMKRSDDPVFPATSTRRFPGLSEPLYYNGDPRARALACVDRSQVCSPDGNSCWSMTSAVPHGIPTNPAYWLMKWSLENSDTYDAIKWRLGTALLAQEHISQSVSTPLSADQWQMEASQLFATSLATIQYDAWGIATGEDHDKPGYIEVTPTEAREQLCGIYKFKTEDYTNVNVAAFIGLLLLAFALFVLSWDTSTFMAICCCCCRERPSQEDEHPDPERLVVDVVASWSIWVVVVIGKGLYYGVKAAPELWRSGWHATKNFAQQLRHGNQFRNEGREGNVAAGPRTEV